MDPNERLQHEFNRWAEAGRGDDMERHHLNITEQVIHQMDLRPGERVLDLACGSGWAARLLARIVGSGPEGFGQVVGLDISDEMVRKARAASRDFENLIYVWGSADKIPWEENSFDKVLSVESFYYFPDPDRALNEIFRVMAPRGRLFILINFYKDSPISLRWADAISVPVHARSEAEYLELLRAHAFENIKAFRIRDQGTEPDEHGGQFFKNEQEAKEFKQTGALLLTANKPDLRSPGPAYTIY